MCTAENMNNALLAVFKSHLTTEVKIIIHAMNTIILGEMTTQLQVLVNTIFMTIQNNSISEQPLAGDHILTVNGKTKKPSVKLLCQWIKTP
jgi:hypothetical protein